MSERQCLAQVAHKPHDWPTVQRVIDTHGGPWHCPGIGSKAIAAEAMKRKGQRQNDWRHLVEAHHIDVSERAYGANVKLWAKVDAQLHEMYDLGYCDAMLSAAEFVSSEAEDRDGGYFDACTVAKERFTHSAAEIIARKDDD